jgi:hypothetical protein
MSPVSIIVRAKTWLEVREIGALAQLTSRKSAASADATGTLHFGRWVSLRGHNHFAYFSEFDGDLRKSVRDASGLMAPVLDLLLEHVVGAPPVPVQKNVDALCDWVVANNLDPIGFYSAYPNLTVRDIRTRSGVVHGAVGKTALQTPFTLVLPAKSPSYLEAASRLIAYALPQFYQAAEAIGTLHFARFVPLGTTALVFVSEFDGEFGEHIQGLSQHLGPLFDAIFQNIADPPPCPVQQNAHAFAEWISSHNVEPWWFYSAYPTLSVQDIRAGAGGTNG